LARSLASDLILLAGLLAVAACGRAAPARSPWSDAAARVTATGLVDRFVEATAALLRTPYEDGPLGEGEGAVPDADPRCDFDRVDCVTFLEQALALALGSGTDAAYLDTLDRIRYRNGHVDFADRNHYMVTDWIPANAWLLEDVTATLAPGRTASVTRTIDRAAFLQGHDVAPRPGADDPRELELAYLPTGALPAADAAIRPGDLVFWVGRADAIFVVHTGLAVRAADGTLLFRHGSSAAGRVLDEPFADYAQRATFALGFLVLRLRDDAPARLAAERDAGAGGTGG